MKDFVQYVNIDDGWLSPKLVGITPETIIKVWNENNLTPSWCVKCWDAVRTTVDELLWFFYTNWEYKDVLWTERSWVLCWYWNSEIVAAVLDKKGDELLAALRWSNAIVRPCF